MIQRSVTHHAGTPKTEARVRFEVVEGLTRDYGLENVVAFVGETADIDIATRPISFPCRSQWLGNILCRDSFIVRRESSKTGMKASKA